MALIKSKELNDGATATYWVAQPANDKVNEKTYVIMLGFKDKETRDAGKQPMTRERIGNINGTYLTGEQIYAAIKISKPRVITPAQDAVLDDSGEVITPAVEEVTEETNWFIDATNDI